MRGHRQRKGGCDDVLVRRRHERLGLCAHDRRDGGVLGAGDRRHRDAGARRNPPGRHRRRRPMHRHRKRLWPCVLLGERSTRTSTGAVSTPCTPIVPARRRNRCACPRPATLHTGGVQGCEATVSAAVVATGGVVGDRAVEHVDREPDDQQTISRDTSTSAISYTAISYTRTTPPLLRPRRPPTLPSVGAHWCAGTDRGVSGAGWWESAPAPGAVPAAPVVGTAVAAA